MESDEENSTTEENELIIHRFSVEYNNPVNPQQKVNELRELLTQPNHPKETGLALLLVLLVEKLTEPPSPELQKKLDNKKKKSKKKKSHK